MISIRSRSGCRNWLKQVGSRDEHHLRKIIRHFQVVITKFNVLFRIQHFQQR